MRLCGISSRFQLLSPCTGQVTHALLTRPPLSNCIRHPEGIRSQLFVRLACVRHAASVHPEPGSNSHIIICPEPNYSSQIALRWHNFVSLSDSLRIMILLESCEVCQFESYDSYWLSSENFILFLWIFRVVWLSNFQGSVFADCPFVFGLSCVSEIYNNKPFYTCQHFFLFFLFFCFFLLLSR